MSEEKIVLTNTQTAEIQRLYPGLSGYKEVVFAKHIIDTDAVPTTPPPSYILVSELPKPVIKIHHGNGRWEWDVNQIAFTNDGVIKEGFVYANASVLDYILVHPYLIETWPRKDKLGNDIRYLFRGTTYVNANGTESDEYGRYIYWFSEMKCRGWEEEYRRLNNLTPGLRTVIIRKS